VDLTRRRKVRGFYGWRGLMQPLPFAALHEKGGAANMPAA
jgi:hypothetical protein